jgi:uncharacterized protein YtpQ (UPF0354 family)
MGVVIERSVTARMTDNDAPMPVDRDRFAAKLVDAITKANLGKVQYLPEDFALQIEGGGRMNLHNALLEYEGAGWFGRGKVIKRWVKFARLTLESALPESFEQARPNVLPYVRDRNFHEHVKLMGATSGQPGVEMPFEVLGGELTVAAAYDGEMTISSINQEQLSKWGVSLDEVLKAARLNIRMRTPSGFAQLNPGLYVSPYRDNHDTARVVLTELITRLDLKGDPVAIAPHRDSLIITGADDPANLAAAAKMALDLLKDNRRVSGHAIRFRGGKWTPFAPPPESPAHEPMRRARMMTLAFDYEQQKDLLQKQVGENVFAASFSVREDTELDRWWSYSVWIEGLPTLLPVTDTVIFQSERFGDDKDIIGPWDWAEVERVAGSLIKIREEVQPPRVFLDAFPTDQMFQELLKPKRG